VPAVRLAVQRVGLGQERGVVGALGARRGRAIVAGVICLVRAAAAAAAIAAVAARRRSPTLLLCLLLLLLLSASPAPATTATMRARPMRLRRAAVALGEPPLAARGVLLGIHD
jgi:hypothetical protein